MEMKRKYRNISKIINFVLVLTIIFTMFPLNKVFATDVGIGTDGRTVDLSLWNYTASGYSYSLSEYKGSFVDGKIIGSVPATINGKLVTAMISTFSGCTGLTQAPIIPSSVTDMASTFSDCTGLTQAPIIPSSVTNMYSTFWGCTGLTQAPIIPSSVTNMYGTFRGCTGLTQAPVIPSSVTNMDSTFYGCTGLTQAPIIPSSVTTMKDTFNYCTGLTQAPIIPSSVTDMSYAFYGCKGLTQAPAIPSSVKTMYGTFIGCTGLTQAPVIPSSVTTMNNTFYYCTGLTQAPIIPSSVTDMSYAFYGCTGLMQAPIIPSSVKDMYYTFYGCTKLTGTVFIPKRVTNLSNIFTNTKNTITMVYSPTNTAAASYVAPANVIKEVDSSKPVITSVIGGATSKITINADDKYIDKYAVTTSNTAPTTGWQTSNVFSNLPYGTLYAWAMDSVGNISESFAFSFFPELSIVSPTDGQVVSNSFSIKFKTIGKNGSKIKSTIKINNTTYYTNENTPENNEISYTLSTKEFAYLPYGVNTVTINICNELGVSYEKSFKITKNVIPEITALPAGTYINFSWTPMEYVVGYDIELDGKIIKTGIKTSYVYTGLKPSTQHTYRIRIVGISGTSNWSSLQTISTTDGIINATPKNILSKATNNTITITWDAVNDADGYDIISVLTDGTAEAAIDNGSLTTCELRGLLPNTTYKYRIRAKNAAGEGPWSDVIELTTYLLDTPQNIITLKSDTSIKLSWGAVSGADGYEIKYYPITQTGGVTGSTNDVSNSAGFTINVTETNATFNDLTPCTEYKYSIRAISSQGISGWRAEKSICTLPQKPGIPDNVNATVSDTKITINWTGLSDTSVVGYDVELDGVILENDTGAIYIHEDLDPYSVHTYRVRARNDLVEGDWSPKKSIRTLPAKPVAPKDITVTSTQTGATLSWKAEQGASGYDIFVFKLDENNKEILIEEIDNIEDCTYTHRRMIKGAEYRYRIRTRNIHGVSAWSGNIINNAIKAQCKKGNTIDLGLTATDVVDFSSYEMTVTFNPGVVEVTDLSTLTGKVELTVGKIEGTDITIKEFSDGRIVFVVDKALTPGEAWTGVINAIKFRAKQTGGTTITYTVFTKPQQ